MDTTEQCTTPPAKSMDTPMSLKLTIAQFTPERSPKRQKSIPEGRGQTLESEPKRQKLAPTLELEENTETQVVGKVTDEGINTSERPDTVVCQPEAFGLDSEPLREVDRQLHELVDAGDMPGILSYVAYKGKIIHLDCYGHADVERNLPMLPDTIVRLYSMSKCVISVAIMMLVEDKKMKLDDSLAKFIPAFKDVQVKDESGKLVAPKREINLLHLMTHTSGIGYGPMLGDKAEEGSTEATYEELISRANLGRTDPKDAKALTSLEKWCDELARLPLLFEPGERWEYSYSHDVLGRIIEVVTGEPLDRFLEQQVFLPLGMVDTGFAVPYAKVRRLAGLYRMEEVSGETEGSESECRTGDESEAKNEHAQAKDISKQASSADSASADSQEVQEELRRLDDADPSHNAWVAGNTSPILAGGGSVDSMTGGLLSTALDYARLCHMLLNKGELDGKRFLSSESVELLTTNQLPKDVWCWNKGGVGFGMLGGSVSVAHPELTDDLRAGEFGWGGMAGTAWTADPAEHFLLMSFSLVAFNLETEEVLRAGLRKAIEDARSKENGKTGNKASSNACSE